LKSGDKACCPYTDTSCVRSGKSDEEVFLVVSKTTIPFEKLNNANYCHKFTGSKKNL
jgi:hypothetical protein